MKKLFKVRWFCPKFQIFYRMLNMVFISVYVVHSFSVITTSLIISYKWKQCNPPLSKLTLQIHSTCNKHATKKITMQCLNISDSSCSIDFLNILLSLLNWKYVYVQKTNSTVVLSTSGKPCTVALTLTVLMQWARRYDINYA